MKTVPIVNFILLLLVIAYLLATHWSSNEEIFDVITTERLNVTGEDGNVYVVISGPERQALATIDGELIDPNATDRPVPGLIFFNRHGDEIGGLIYDIDSTNNFQMLTFDQRKGDQIMTLRNDESLSGDTWNRRTGLQFLERSREHSPRQFAIEYDSIAAISNDEARKAAFGELFGRPENKVTFRMHVGRLFNGRTGLFLFDDAENMRLGIYLDEDGNPQITRIDSLVTDR